MIRTLSAAERLLAFRHVTRGLVTHYAHDLRCGMSDENLGIALHNTFGAFAALTVDRLHLAYRGRGLMIWASRAPVDTCTVLPLWRGHATIAFARRLYGIAEPEPCPPDRRHLSRPGAAFPLHPCTPAPRSALLLPSGPKEGLIR